ncbi:hypothetical protein M0Q50_05230 [bacterium]|jgi:hypothetical protein|nr:hypothetical protein [bacterium]
MLLGIISIVAIILGIRLINHWDDDYNIVGWFVTVIFAITFVLNGILLLTVEYDYNIFKTKRDAFEKTLQNSRKSGNSLESAAIISEVAIWNIQLAEKKYDNNTYIWGRYISDKIETLEPIK